MKIQTLKNAAMIMLSVFFENSIFWYPSQKMNVLKHLQILFGLMKQLFLSFQRVVKTSEKHIFDKNIFFLWSSGRYRGILFNEKFELVLYFVYWFF